jgi:hypothetical protein
VSDLIATSAAQGSLEPLFTAVLQYQSDCRKSAVVPSEGRDGAFIGTSDGTVSGTLLRGTVRTSLWSGNCVYPLVRRGQAIPEGLHICMMNPVGFIETSDGARIRFDGRGYGVRGPQKYRTSLTLIFGTEDARYAWLTKTIGVMEGDSTRRRVARYGTSMSPQTHIDRRAPCVSLNRTKGLEWIQAP